MNTRGLFGAVLLASLWGGAVSAQVVITVDELGNGFGTVGQGFIGNDPGPGGLNGVLIYNLPFAGLQGDVLINEPGAGGIQDVIRFNGNGTLIFYSDNVGGADAPADTPTPPGAFYANQAIITEQGPEGNNFALYTPTANQPGFNPGAVPISYRFVSDGSAVPEPSPLLLTGVAGLLGFAFRHVVHRRRADT